MRVVTRRGVLLALTAAVLFGVSAPLAKSLLATTSPQLLAGLLYLGSGLGLLVVWSLRRGSHRSTHEVLLSRQDLPWLAGTVLTGGILGPVLLMIGLSRTPASTAALLLNFESVGTAGLAWVLFRENVDRRIVLGMVLIFLGGVALSWQGRAEGTPLGGILAIVGACLCWGLDNNLSQKIAAADPIQIALIKGLIAGLVNTAMAWLRGANIPAPEALGAALLVGFLSYGSSLVAFVLALRSLGTARTGAYFATAPFVGAALSVVVWQEALSPRLMAGSLLMAGGLWLHLTERHSHLHHHTRLEHDHLHRHDAHHQHGHDSADPPGEPHAHAHRHDDLPHTHPHYPDIHHRHEHS